MNTAESRPIEVPDAPTGSQREASVSSWNAFVAAVQFLTRLPIAASTPLSESVLQRSPIFFPLVGGLVGMTTTLVAWGAGCFWPVWLAIPIALAVEALLTGALHEDAVADVCDAFGGGWTREDVLRILRDSRIGAYGGLGLVLVVILRAGAMVALWNSSAPSEIAGAVVAAAAVGRWVSVLAMVVVPPAPGREGLARDVGSRLSRRDLLISSLWGLPFVVPFVVLSPVHSILASVLLAAGTWWFLSLVKRRLGGVTGDCLGCLTCLSQLAVLLAASAAIPSGGGLW